MQRTLYIHTYIHIYIHIMCVANLYLYNMGRDDATLCHALLASLCDGCDEARRAAFAALPALLRHLAALPRAVCAVLVSVFHGDVDLCEAADEALVAAVAALLQAPLRILKYEAMQ